jgi:hypothetical protein
MLFEDAGTPRFARCVALTQESRGHGVSTAAYYLGRVLVAQGLRVLLIDLTGRRARLASLVSRNPVKNLVLWTPALARPLDVCSALGRARRETAGKADVMILDVDASFLERAGGFALDLDFVIAVADSTDTGHVAVERVANRLHDQPPPHGRVGVVFSRVDPPSAAELPEKTAHRGLPVLGYYPADYLLAGGDAYSLKGNEPAFPHDSYLQALVRVGQKLIQIVPLARSSGGTVGAGTHAPAPEVGNHPVH